MWNHHHRRCRRTQQQHRENTTCLFLVRSVRREKGHSDGVGHVHWMETFHLHFLLAIVRCVSVESRCPFAKGEVELEFNLKMEILSMLKHQPFLFNSVDGKMDQCLCFVFSLSTFRSKWIKNFLKDTRHRHNPIDTLPMIKFSHGLSARFLSAIALKMSAFIFFCSLCLCPFILSVCCHSSILT